MNHLILLAVAVFGILLIVKKDFLEQNLPSQINSSIGFVYDNNTVVGGILLVGTYYLYTQQMKQMGITPMQGSSSSE